MFHLLFTFLGILFIQLIDVYLISSIVLILGCLFAAWANRQVNNLIFLCVIIVISTLLEVGVLGLIDKTSKPYVWTNNRIFLTHLIFDVCTLFCVAYRGGIFRWINNKLHRPTGDIYLIRADLAMMLVLTLFILVDLSAIVENLLRNLDHLGFSEALAKPLWELNWIFYHYEYFKRFLMGMQFLVLWSMLGDNAKKRKSNYLSIRA